MDTNNDTRSAAKPTLAEALEFAQDLPADCYADRCIIVLAAEVMRLRSEMYLGVVDGFHRAARTLTLQFNEMPQQVALGDRWEARAALAGGAK